MFTPFTRTLRAAALQNRNLICPNTTRHFHSSISIFNQHVGITRGRNRKGNRTKDRKGNRTTTTVDHDDDDEEEKEVAEEEERTDDESLKVGNKVHYKEFRSEINAKDPNAPIQVIVEDGVVEETWSLEGEELKHQDSRRSVARPKKIRKRPIQRSSSFGVDLSVEDKLLLKHNKVEGMKEIIREAEREQFEDDGVEYSKSGHVEGVPPAKTF